MAPRDFREEGTERSVLVADPNRAVCENLIGALTEWGFMAESVDRFDEILARASSRDWSAVFLEAHWPQAGGADIQCQILDADSDLNLVIMTSNPTTELAIKALRAGACDFLVKPFGLDDLASAIKRCIMRSDRRQRVRLPVSNP
jgi:DNA-binding NtrC family response regulator